ncbi:MAG: hypothetical protein M0C28_19830 [Candidatus Moduliflexus flocculans]|nr:hypothetical protein [Candidatus Moduliflexus flocculans]
MHVIDHLYLPAVDIEDGLAHEMLVHEYPTRLIDKRRIHVALSGRPDKDGIIFDLYHI